MVHVLMCNAFSQNLGPLSNDLQTLNIHTISRSECIDRLRYEHLAITAHESHFCTLNEVSKVRMNSRTFERTYLVTPHVELSHIWRVCVLTNGLKHSHVCDSLMCEVANYVRTNVRLCIQKILSHTCYIHNSTPRVHVQVIVVGQLCWMVSLLVSSTGAFRAERGFQRVLIKLKFKVFFLFSKQNKIKPFQLFSNPRPR